MKKINKPDITDYGGRSPDISVRPAYEQKAVIRCWKDILHMKLII